MDDLLISDNVLTFNRQGVGIESVHIKPLKGIILQSTNE